MDLIEELERFHFSRMEARIYVSLVSHGQMNGSQLARELGVNRSSVYTALNHLSERGAVHTIAGEPTEYAPVDPAELVRNYRHEYEQSLEFLRDELDRFREQGRQHQYYNLRGKEQCLHRITEVISSAQRELCGNSNLDFSLLDGALRDASNRGVRIIAFSFQPVPECDYPIEVYYNRKFNLSGADDRRILLVADMREALIAGGNDTRGYMGTFSSDPLLISVVAEHIHHDIYVQRLEHEAGRNLITEKIKIGSMLETQFSEWVENVGAPGANE